MKLIEAQGRVAEIRELAWDHERAHRMEDELYAAVLAAIAVSARGGSQLARAALETKVIHFERWRA